MKFTFERSKIKKGLKDVELETELSQEDIDVIKKINDLESDNKRKSVSRQIIWFEKWIIGKRTAPPPFQLVNPSDFQNHLI